MKKRQRRWTITLGCCGPWCPKKKGKEYGIESLAWRVLSHHWNINEQKGSVPEKIAKIVWKKCNEDRVS
jgi:hypothetical protein